MPRKTSHIPEKFCLFNRTEGRWIGGVCCREGCWTGGVLCRDGLWIGGVGRLLTSTTGGTLVVYSIVKTNVALGDLIK